MKLYIFPPSGRVLGIVALKNYLALDCEVQAIDLGRGDQLTPQYSGSQSQQENADAGGRWFRAFGDRMPSCSTWRPSTPTAGCGPLICKVRRAFCAGSHGKARTGMPSSIGMVSYEKASKVVLSRGPSDPAFIARGEQNFSRFAAVLDEYLSEARPGSSVSG